MKKLIKGLLAAMFGTMVLIAPAAAQSSCTITNTGPGSNNGCTVNQTNVVTVTCTNTASITNVNTQNAQSGSVSVSGNTISGTATSGNAANVNALANDLAQGCGPAATTTTTTPTPTPPAAQQPAGRGADAVASLPKTGVISPAEYVVGGLAVVSGLAVAAGVTRRVLAD